MEKPQREWQEENADSESPPPNPPPPCSLCPASISVSLTSVTAQTQASLPCTGDKDAMKMLQNPAGGALYTNITLYSVSLADTQLMLTKTGQNKAGPRCVNDTEW